MVHDTSARRRNGIVALAAGAALLIGGGTYSLWSATDTIPGGTITAGNLALTKGTLGSYDVSADRADSTVDVIKNTAATPAALTFNTGEIDTYNGVGTTAGTDGDDATMGIKAINDELNGHAVDLTTWLIVPGDTAAVTLPFTVAMTGDNLVAQLAMDTAGLTQANTDMTYSYAIFGDDGQQIGAIQAITPGATGIPVALFQADGTDQGGTDDQYLDASATLVTVPVVNGTASVTVVIFGHFTDTGSTQAIDNVTKADTLGNVTLTLTQVRDLTDNFGNASQFPPAQP